MIDYTVSAALMSDWDYHPKLTRQATQQQQQPTRTPTPTPTLTRTCREIRKPPKFDPKPLGRSDRASLVIKLKLQLKLKPIDLNRVTANS